MKKIERAITWIEKKAKDPSHGYSQDTRWGPDYDCSSAVISAWESAGVPVKSRGATYTGNMYTIFLKCGFKDVTTEVDLSTGSGLVRGDVLLNHKRHTAMYCGNGMEVEASINETGGAHGGKPGDQTGREFLIRKYRNYPWNCVLRYTGNGNVSRETLHAKSAKKFLISGKCAPNIAPKFCGVVSVSDFLCVRKWAGVENPECSFSPLYDSYKVYVCDAILDSKGNTWYYIKYNGKYGFVHSKFIK